MTLDFLHAVTGGHSLTEQQAESAMRALLAGESTPVLTAAFLTALRMKGETVNELTGFARAMRAASTPLPIDPAARPLLDTCGTGGGGKGTFNISTVTAIVVGAFSTAQDGRLRMIVDGGLYVRMLAGVAALGLVAGALPVRAVLRRRSLPAISESN